jgi:hypothetical protein
METLYVKDGRKYRKIGCTSSVEYMRDGLWLIQTHPGSKEYNNMSIRLNDLPQPSEMPKFIKAFVTKDAIINAIDNLQKTKKLQFYNVSMQDIAEEIVTEVYKNSMKAK